MFFKKFISVLLIALMIIGFSQLVFAEISLDTPSLPSLSSEKNLVVHDSSLGISSEESVSQSDIPSSESSVSEILSSMPEPSSSHQVSSNTSQQVSSKPSSNGIIVIPFESKTSHDSPNDSDSESEIKSSTPQSTVSAEPNNEFWTEDLSLVLSGACDWMKNSEHGQLYFLCMGTAGKSVVSQSVNQYITDVSLKKSYTDITEVSYDILNITFSGYHANNVRGKNLLQELSDYPNYEQIGLFPIIYTLLALDSNNYPLPMNSRLSRDTLVELLLKFQNDDGGFSGLVSSYSAVVHTAMALTALSPYRLQEKVQQAIDKGLLYLEQQQRPEGGYTSEGIPSSIADSSVLIALNSLGIPINDSRFVKKDTTLVDVLLSYANSNSSFRQLPYTDENIQATEFAVLALSAVKKQSSPFVLSTTLKETSNSGSKNVIIPKDSKDNRFTFISIVILIVLIIILIGIAFIIKVRLLKQKQNLSSDEENVYSILNQETHSDLEINDIDENK